MPTDQHHFGGKLGKQRDHVRENSSVIIWKQSEVLNHVFKLKSLKRLNLETFTEIYEFSLQVFMLSI